MNQQDFYERILASLQAGVFDDARWPATSGLLDEFCRTKGNALAIGGGATSDQVRVFFAQFCRRGQHLVDLQREYFETYYAVDERVPRIRRLPDSQLTPIPSLLTKEERKNSPVYNELTPRTNTQNGLTVRLDGPDGSHIVWTIGDPVTGDGWSSAQVRKIEWFLPHLRRFARIRQALVDAKALGSSLVDLLGNIRLGVVQLDRRGRVIEANDRARAILRKGDGLLHGDGILRASLPRDDAQLQKLLARALPFPGGSGVGGSMMVSREHAASRLVLHVSPVHADGMEPHKSRLGALVLIVDPAQRLRVDPDRLAAVLGLTPAQSHVAASLVEGKSIRDIAVESGRSPTTIKWHIKHIFARHGLSRQADLVRLVASLADAPDMRR
ncbi:MAG: helix-turn-helix transcriptional regulator [Defluviicoccus sp.]|nr:helix-turn-helix transcriptional regulator [Defluviicoccus sp.]MDE0382933.1 helix-turn-helix transcriptional regulator [Defluviicoccus sp.]